MSKAPNHKGKSPYARKGKSPYRYSELFNAWLRAVVEGSTSEARRLGRQHSERYFGKSGQAQVSDVPLGGRRFFGHARAA